MSKKSKENMLDYIPVMNKEYTWKTNKKGRVVVSRANKGLFNRIAQVVFGRPKVSHIDLDEFGSFVWIYIDGSNTIYDISIMVKEHFGEKAEPLYDRLIKYFQILQNHKFVTLQKPAR